MISFDAIVLAGGSARRLDGADKPLVEVRGRPMLAHVLDAVSGARQVVVVGPTRPHLGNVTWRQEDPPGGGPVAALRAGIDAVTADVVLVLAADLPDIGPAVAELLGRLGPAPLALLVTDDRPNYLAAAWRTGALRAGLAECGPSMRSLIEPLPWVPVIDEQGWGRDCDTWPEIERARGSQT